MKKIVIGLTFLTIAILLVSTKNINLQNKEKEIENNSQIIELENHKVEIIKEEKTKGYLYNIFINNNLMIKDIQTSCLAKFDIKEINQELAIAFNKTCDNQNNAIYLFDNLKLIKTITEEEIEGLKYKLYKIDDGNNLIEIVDNKFSYNLRATNNGYFEFKNKNYFICDELPEELKKRFNSFPLNEKIKTKTLEEYKQTFGC